MKILPAILESSKARTVGLVALVGTLVAADIVSAFETTMLFTAVASLLAEYGRPATVGWVLTAYLLISAASAAVCGRLGDLYGRRRVLIMVLVASGVGSLVSALSPSLEGVILGRGLQGLSGAILPLVLGLARQHITPRALPISLGVIVAAQTAGAGLGMMLGGFLVDTVGWRGIFWAALGFLTVALIAVRLLIPASSGAKDERSLDLGGGLLFLPAVAGALFAISNGRAWHWGVGFWALLAASLALGAVWVRHELRHSNPLIEVRLLARREIVLPNLCMSLCALGAFQFPQLLLLQLQQPAWTGFGLGLSATFAGLLMVPANFIAWGWSPVTGWLYGRWGAATCIMVGMGAAVLGALALIAYPNVLPLIVGFSVFSLIGTTMVYVSVSSTLVNVAPMGRTSETIGMYSVIRSLSMAVGTQIMLTLLATSTVKPAGGGPGEFPSPGAHQLAWIVMASACLASALAALLLLQGRAGSRPESVIAPELGEVGSLN
jgi:MFS family permease